MAGWGCCRSRRLLPPPEPSSAAATAAPPSAAAVRCRSPRARTPPLPTLWPGRPSPLLCSFSCTSRDGGAKAGEGKMQGLGERRGGGIGGEERREGLGEREDASHWRLGFSTL